MRSSERTGYLYVLIVFVLVGLPVTAATYLLYCIYSFLQVKVFISISELLLIQSDYTIWIFIVCGFVFFILLTLRFEYGSSVDIFIKRVHSFRVKTLLISTTVLFLILFIYVFFNFTIITTEGITVKNNFLNYTEYRWNEAKEVKIYYSYVQRKMSVDKKLHYEIITNNGLRFDLTKSKMFWDKILEVNKEVRKYKVPVLSDEIKQEIIKDASIFQKYNLEMSKNYKILIELVQ